MMTAVNCLLLNFYLIKVVHSLYFMVIYLYALLCHVICFNFLFDVFSHQRKMLMEPEDSQMYLLMFSLFRAGPLCKISRSSPLCWVLSSFLFSLLWLLLLLLYFIFCTTSILTLLNKTLLTKTPKLRSVWLTFLIVSSILYILIF